MSGFAGSQDVYPPGWTDGHCRTHNSVLRVGTRTHDQELPTNKEKLKYRCFVQNARNHIRLTAHYVT